MEISELKTMLNSRKVMVTFKKVNGDVREMECTTNLDLIPPSGWPSGKVKMTEEASNRTVRVFDLKAQGWRSFIADNIISAV